MTNEWIGLTDDKLASAAEQGPHAQIEAMRRLRVAIDRASIQNETYVRRMFWLNLTLMLMTIVMAIAAIPTIFQVAVVKAWSS